MSKMTAILAKWVPGGTILLTALAVLMIFPQTYELREKIIGGIDAVAGHNHHSPGHKGHDYWAREIMKGGYILHFRHAEREKWIDVQMYDALESDLHQNGKNQSRLAEFDYFTKAVCLNSRGVTQARAMGEVLSHIKLPVGKVISSPSCRSRQTADIAFGGYDELHRILVHKGPYKENNAARVDSLRNLYSSLEIENGTNTVVSAHNSVVDKGMFTNFHSFSDLYLEEGGFYVISKKDNGDLVLEHEFHYFKDFSKQFFPR